jgi:hypothetical protein
MTFLPALWPAAWSFASRLVGPAVIGCVLLAAVWGYGVRERARGLDAGRAEINALWVADKAERERVAREGSEELRRLEQRRQSVNQEVRDADAREAARARASAVAAGAERDRLLVDVAARAGGAAAGADAGAAGRPDDAADAWDVVRGCTGALVALAAEADETERRLAGLQGYVRGVCLSGQADQAP